MWETLWNTEREREREREAEREDDDDYDLKRDHDDGMMVVECPYIASPIAGAYLL